jgi:hypothetical protein
MTIAIFYFLFLFSVDVFCLQEADGAEKSAEEKAQELIDRTVSICFSVDI